MKTFLDVGAGVTVLMVVYAVSDLFITLPDLTPYTYNAFPGSLLVFPVFFLFFYCLRNAFRHRRWYWFVGCLFCWPLSALYYFLISRKEFGAHAAQQGAPADPPRPAGSAGG
jgi:ABC-type multidrug transport system permease subunit